MPFTTEQFFAVFARYNQGVWPAQIALLALAAAVVVAVHLPWRGSGRFVAATLALFWALMGLAYHLLYFRAINPAAALFAGLSLAGAALFAWGALRGWLRFDGARGARAALGYLLWAYALADYPLAGHLAGHRYPAAPTFGLACPTTIFTLGALLLASPHAPRRLYVVPLLWAAIGSVAAFQLGVPQDFGLAVAGLIGLWGCLDRRAPRPAAA